MTDQEMIYPNYVDNAVLGDVGDHAKWVPELLESEIYSELALRAKGKKWEDVEPYEAEASIIEHLEDYLGRYEHEIWRELGMVAQGKRKGWKPETIKYHRELALYAMQQRDEILPKIQRRKRELIESVTKGIKLEMPRLINDGK